MRSLLIVCLAGMAIFTAGMPEVLGQTAGSGMEPVSKVMSDTPPTESNTKQAARSAGSRFGWLWFPGAIAAYIALQLWILPKMGVAT